MSNELNKTSLTCAVMVDIYSEEIKRAIDLAQRRFSNDFSECNCSTKDDPLERALKIALITYSEKCPT